jgi:hypothetical protein
MREFEFEALGEADLHVDAIYSGGRAGTSGDDPISKLLPVGNMGGFRYTGRSARPRLCALYSDMADPDWPDSLDPESGRFVYFGDNKTPGHEVHDRKGNRVLRAAFEALHEGRREDVPPFLIFTKAGRWRDVVFRGLAVPGNPGLGPTEDLVAIWKSRAGERFQNYKAVFTILDVPVVPRRWLEALADPQRSSMAPDAWAEWVGTGMCRGLMAERTREYRTPQEQLPSDPARASLLEAVHSYFPDHPEGAYAFERCAADLVSRMDSNVGRIDLTRPWRDGGRDALGSYRIGSPSSGISVDFALEAKCKTPDGRHGSGVRETSRLVSRLLHRQFGVFVTTSFVSLQAYKEIIEDRHPVLIISGADVIDILYSANINTLKKVRSWLRSVAPKE